jgi:asparaginyl-tRNA synthetase
MLKVRAATFAAYHECMTGLGYMEHQSPSFTPTPGESGAETFEVKYFKDKAYLTQTWQLYAEAMLPIMEKIYTVAPSFRADKSMTSRHLTEYWHAEVETAWQEFPELLGQMEYIVKFIAAKIAKTCRKELIFLGKDPKYFAKLPKFKRIKYREAISELKKGGFKVKFGDDLGTVEEKYLVDKRKIPLFITHYPTKLKAFYMKRDPKDKSAVFASDLMLPGIGETIGSAERSTDFKDVKKRLLAAGEDPKVYEWYFEAVSKYGSVPHSGFGMGMERLIMWFTGAESVKEVIAFPRTPTRFAP